ncbi:MAG TPA: aminopeptidase [bacterium]|nr:aminopeptidase [bacterium]
MNDPRLDKLAKVLVHYSTRVKKGEFVFVRADEVAAPWVVAVTREATRAGAHVEVMLSSQEATEARLKYATDEELKNGNYMLEKMLERADVWLTAWAARNVKVNAAIPADRLKIDAQGQGGWRKIYSDRMASGKLRWCGTQFPTYADAQEANMSLEDYENFVYGAGLLDKDDPAAAWKKVSESQERWVKWLDTKKSLHIVSEGTDITVGVAGKKWINCDGRVNFPDGEVFTSPEDTNINGHITFSFPGIYAGKEIEGIRLEVKDGLVVKATARKGEDLLQALLKTDEGASRFGEVAVGTNYGIQRFTRNMLFDEKIGGTVHMALGNSMAEAGGKNHSAIHWDMLCDMRQGGTITADGKLFYKDGKFIDEVLI